jgi:hypothetical protein
MKSTACILDRKVLEATYTKSLACLPRFLDKTNEFSTYKNISPNSRKAILLSKQSTKAAKKQKDSDKTTERKVCTLNH